MKKLNYKEKEIIENHDSFEYAGEYFRTLEAAHAAIDADLNDDGEEVIPPVLDGKNSYSISNRKRFGEFVDDFCQGKKWSIAEFSDHLDVSRPTIYGWMDGSSVPSTKHFRKICQQTGLTKHELNYLLEENKQNFWKSRFELEGGNNADLVVSSK